MKRLWPLLACSATVLVLTPLAGGAAGQEGDVGYRGPSTTGISNSSPTGAKPESKLWWNDGYWWASMFDTSSDDYHIFRHDLAEHTWVDTGVVVDPRPNSRADTLWDGNKLYVASHMFTNTGGPASSSNVSRLYRYSYDATADTYWLDSGFPVEINGSQSEALVLDKDSTGKLWITWVEGGQVWVNRTVGDDLTWGTPFALPAAGAANLTTDDISSLVAFGGNKIGVMWSNQTDSAFYFSVHADGQPDMTWEPAVAPLSGSLMADDHINLKAASDGRVFAAVKTSQTTPSAPLAVLLARDPATGAWTSHTYGTKAEHHTRPIVMLDEANGVIVMLGVSAEAGGTIYKKTSPMNAISFPSGQGTPFMHDGTSEDVNDATSSKQPLNTTTGLVALGSNDTTDQYWHNYDSLVLGADFTTSRTSGAAPLTVDLTDASSGNPTAWTWNFGDGTPASSLQNPSHQYDAPGTYTVTLTASTPNGVSDTETKVGYITVTPSVTFASVADSWVRSTAPTTNYGSQASVNVKTGTATSTFHNAYLKFDVSGLIAPITEAKLRLWVTDWSKDGGSVYLVDNAWTESGITWNNAPVISGSALGSAGATTNGTWVEVPLPASVFAAGNGTYSFAVRNDNNDTASYNSRQSANPPRLVLGIP